MYNGKIRKLHAYPSLCVESLVCVFLFFSYTMCVFNMVYGRHTHSSHRCFRNKPPASTKIHLGWIASWQWASAAKKMFMTHVRTCSRILSKLAVEFSPSSHLVPDRGENGGHVQASTTDQASLSHNLSFHVQSCSQQFKRA